MRVCFCRYLMMGYGLVLVFCFTIGSVRASIFCSISGNVLHV